jgi:hypothetical protein
MSVTLRAGSSTLEVGSADFLNAFFSTICVRLEGQEWGVRFPVLMRELYGGRMPAAKCAIGLGELEVITRELEALPPSDVVWDFEDRGARPPWGDRIAPTITSLGNYFWTSDGKPLLEVLRSALELGSNGMIDIVIE